MRPDARAGSRTAARSWAALAALLPLILALLLAPLIGAAQLGLQPVPPLQSRVTDLTGTLDAATRARIESRLEAFEQRKGSQVAVLMVGSTAPEPIEDFSIRVAEAWKIGRGRVEGQRVDDGVLLVVAKDDRRLRIEVGYGLEGAIPDARAKQVIENVIAPRFRQGDFAGGVEAGADALMKLIEGEELPAPTRGQAPAGDAGVDWVAVLLFAFFVGLILRQWFGRVLGSSAGALFGGAAAWTFGAGLLVAVGAGLLMFFVLLTMGAGAGMGRVGRHTWRSGPGGFPGGFGGGGGFPRGGGGFGGGGFRGGGGGFGGGGASGGW